MRTPRGRRPPLKPGSERWIFPDRFDYNGRNLDDVVVSEVEMFRLEYMDANCVWLRCYRKDKPDVVFCLNADGPIRSSHELDGKEGVIPMIDGATLIAWGFKPGKHFRDMIAAANSMRAAGDGDDYIFKILQTMVPVETLLRTNGHPYATFLDVETPEERDNAEKVAVHMDALMRVPTIVAGAVMPDACPSGSQEGTIPVGGVVACKDAIHPGFHSSDICCSVAMSIFTRNDDPELILDAVGEITHFGPGGRTTPVQPPKGVMNAIRDNRFLAGLEGYALSQFATQGDGNHFAYVGRIKSSGKVVLVTHHGSRGLGAQLYKRGMATAKRHTAIHAPQVPAHNAWIKASSEAGQDYWDALQTVRTWTKESHFAIHNMAALRMGNHIQTQTWNEHNFVFRKDDGLFYHGKGATPSWNNYAHDDDGLTLIPLNMAEPILIVSHRNKKEALGFAPHGAGRNMGRKAFLRGTPPELPKGIDARFYCGKADLSEFPEAYKNAASVRAQIEKYGLATVVDEVIPYGNIMAGDWEADAPWRKRKASP